MLTRHRQRLLEEWTRRVESDLRSVALDRVELVDHMPSFLDGLASDLCPTSPAHPDSCGSAAEHGRQRLRLGFNVREVVREYGLLHTTILTLAEATGVELSQREQIAIVDHIGAGTGDALSEYVAQRDAQLQRQSSEHLGFIAHELRGALAGARIAADLLRERQDGGRLLKMLDKALGRAVWLIDSTLTHAWLKLGVEPRIAPVDLRALLEELRSELGIEGERKGVEIETSVDSDRPLEADARLLRSAISNILRNAVKFTRPNSTVALRAFSRDERIVIEVEDRCGGLPPGESDKLFDSTVQRGEDRSGFGLGLAIARQAVAAHNGVIAVRNLPGKGCVFAIELSAAPAYRPQLPRAPD
jgi:signal transduction histidine kinase